MYIHRYQGIEVKALVSPIDIMNATSRRITCSIFFCKILPSPFPIAPSHSIDHIPDYPTDGATFSMVAAPPSRWFSNAQMHARICAWSKMQDTMQLHDATRWQTLERNFRIFRIFQRQY